MARPRYTAEQLEFLKTGFLAMQKPELTAAFNARFGQAKTELQIKATLANHKFRCNRKVGNPAGTCLIYTPKQVAWLMANYTGRGHAELADGLNAAFENNKTPEQIKTFLGKRGLNTGRTGQFKKGIVPWNTDTKGTGVCKPNSGTFRSGNVPGNIKPLWDERICPKDGFILMKVPEKDPNTGFATRYKHKHVWIWEQANGPTPEGMAVVFIDSDKLHCELDNLMLLSRAELLNLNLHKYKEQPAAIRPSILALAKLEAKAGIRTTGRVPGAGRKKKEAA